MATNAESQQRQISAGDLDWLAIWRAMYDAEHAQTEALVGSQRATDRWAGRTRRFAQSSVRAPQPDAFLRFVLPYLRPDNSVLDVGAGTGRHALFLVSQVAQLVAVEPSASMRQHLQQRLAEANITNATVVPTSWPAAEAPSWDIAICAGGCICPRIRPATRGCWQRSTI